jgi:hypothetical protein
MRAVTVTVCTRTVGCALSVVCMGRSIAPLSPRARNEHILCTAQRGSRGAKHGARCVRMHVPECYALNVSVALRSLHQHRVALLTVAAARVVAAVARMPR